MQKSTLIKNIPFDHLISSGKRILFATVPGDGHFNPLTGLAVHLQYIGHDVRWYTSATYAEKLRKLLIPHYSFKKAVDINGENGEQLFPERKNIKGMIKRLCFDLINGFILRSTEYFEDIKEIHKSFPFDMVICDCMFMAIPFIREKLHVPVISVGVLPLTETSKDLAPAGLGLMPSGTFWGRRKQDLLRLVADKILFSKPNKVMTSLLNRYGIKVEGSNAFDMLIRKSTLLLQSGTPGFEYYRSDLGRNIRFIGALLPYNAKNKRHSWYNEKLTQYSRVLLVTQGTVEKDTSKLLIPTLEAFKDTDYLVVATTGSSGTKELQEKYAFDNIIVEDFIPFSEVMPYADIYITNGGYGGVMLSIQNKLPMVVSGVHEGKSEINARVEYFKLGINLRTEKPTPSQIRKGVEKVLNDQTYQNNIDKLSNEFSSYNPYELCTFYISQVLNKQNRIKVF
ncbi:MAG TPA: nucleotide disphospho-sugar-binding domain-containing protein [Chitinophagaceae bacterium]|jgi:MGT family glycosyltransferase